MNLFIITKPIIDTIELSNFITPIDSILYLQDGIYNLIMHTNIVQKPPYLYIKQFALNSDLTAAGLSAEYLLATIKNLTLIDYNQFVNLAVQNKHIITW